MRNTLAEVNNLITLAKSFDILADRTTAEPPMALVHGETGYGKTTAVEWMLNRTQESGHRGYYIRASSVWTLSGMLKGILHGLGISPKHGNQRNLDLLVEYLTIHKIALFIDESNYIIRKLELLNAIRDIHDLTKRPIVLVGTGTIEFDLKREPQIDRRVTQRIKFHALTNGDAQIVADTCCEVLVTKELVEKLNTWAGGMIGLVVVALAEIERHAKREGISQADPDWWSDRSFRRGG